MTLDSPACAAPGRRSSDLGDRFVRLAAAVVLTASTALGGTMPAGAGVTLNGRICGRWSQKGWVGLDVGGGVNPAMFILPSG